MKILVGITLVLAIAIFCVVMRDKFRACHLCVSQRISTMCPIYMDCNHKFERQEQ